MFNQRVIYQEEFYSFLIVVSDAIFIIY